MLFVTGSYTEENSPASRPVGRGICLYSFVPEPPFLKLLQELHLRNPSYPIWISEYNLLLAAEEIMDEEMPMLVSYRLKQDELVFNEQVILSGSSACHMAKVANKLLVANYTSSDICEVDFDNGTLSGKQIAKHRHAGRGFNLERQDAAHPHMIYPINDNSFWVVDLGLDKVFTYERTAEGVPFERVASKTIELPSGTGPRHMISLQQHAYLVILGELSGELFLYKHVGLGYELLHSVLLFDKGEASAAAIVTDPFERFLYVSERNTNCIYQFALANDTLAPVDTVYCGGDTPRDISIDPSGEWLLAANQDSNSIAVFSIRQLDGHLTLEHSASVGSPVCITWLIS